MSEKIVIIVEVDDSQLRQTEANVQTFEKESHTIIDEVDNRTRRSFNQVVNMARGAYLLGLGMVK